MKLHQLLAIEKGVRKRVTEGITEQHRITQDPRLLGGIAKTYKPKDENGQRYPDEVSPVTVRYREALDIANALWAEAVNVEARKDQANLTALARVSVNDLEILPPVPATFLLFLEKQLENVRTFVEKIVELPAGMEWHYNAQNGLHESGERLTIRTEKVQEALVLYPATDKHPAQAQMITTDRPVGEWTTTHSHGGIPAELKREWLRKVNTLLDAVKIAREEANTIDVPEERAYGEALLRYIFE